MMPCGCCQKEFEAASMKAVILTPPIFGWDKVNKWHEVKKSYICENCWVVIAGLVKV